MCGHVIFFTYVSPCVFYFFNNEQCEGHAPQYKGFSLQILPNALIFTDILQPLLQQSD